LYDILCVNLRPVHEATLSNLQSGLKRVEFTPLRFNFESLALLPDHIRRKRMNKDRIEGSAKQAKGAVKDAAGKLTGDAKLQAEGKADKAAGKVQNAFGGLKDKAAKN
jgi:uncharacterized protein YjbJ (UPF0337 family)